MEILIFVGIVIVVPILIIIAQQMAVSNPASAMDVMLASLPDFNATQKVVGCDGGAGIAIDEQRKKVCMVTFRPRNSTTDTYSFRDLIASEIFEDGDIITRISRSTQASRGSSDEPDPERIDATLDSQSEGRTTTQRNKRIALRVRANRTTESLHEITLMDGASSIDGTAYAAAMQQARHWHRLIASLIRVTDEDEKLTKKY
jgi:hypothetical protein